MLGRRLLLVLITVDADEDPGIGLVLPLPLAEEMGGSKEDGGRAKSIQMQNFLIVYIS